MIYSLFKKGNSGMLLEVKNKIIILIHDYNIVH